MENVKLHPLKEGVKIEEIDSSKKATYYLSVLIFKKANFNFLDLKV